MNDDKDQSFQQLSRHYGAPIVSQLVDIASKCNQQDHIKFRSFISNLECLQPTGLKLRRRSINAFRERQYVALSYTWDRSEYENPEIGQYLVENSDNKYFQLSTVRKCILDRALRYMHHFDIRFLWIDCHCIRQDSFDGCSDDCALHFSCVDKRDALQAMDLVYQRSEHPVALLGRPLRTGTELRLLSRILSGELVDGDGDGEFRFSLATAVHVALKALLLLSEITRDRWWTRAWTFQENYRGGMQMRLLILHDQSLEAQKRRHGVFGEIPGELSMWSVEFSTQATRLCLALRGLATLSPTDKKRIDGVLRAAGKYTLLVPSSSSMTPAVVGDVEARGLSKPWDRLAIVANCCQYPVRLDGGALSRQGRSPSLSVLAMCLLNGEILDNGNTDVASINELKGSEFLNRFMFRKFNAPQDETRRLSFNKGCRLSHVELTVGGIATKGQLWKLGPIIDTAVFPRELPWINKPRGRLALNERKSLLQLFLHLRGLGHRGLADQIDRYLADDADAYAEEEYRSFTEMHLHRMAAELAAAILARQKLRLGTIWDTPERPPLYHALFVCLDQGGNGPYPSAAFAFTSAWQGDSGSQTHNANDVDRHVSLEVQGEFVGSDGVPHLRVCRWLPGMCFFYGCELTKVVFPWPRALHGV